MLNENDLLEKQGVSEFSEKAYLDYAMYVILDRCVAQSLRWPKTRAKAHYLCDVRTWLKKRIKI